VISSNFLANCSDNILFDGFSIKLVFPVLPGNHLDSWDQNNNHQSFQYILLIIYVISELAKASCNLSLFSSVEKASIHFCLSLKNCS
jgi:hypothetical protein